MRTSNFAVAVLGFFISISSFTVSARSNNPEGIMYGSTVFKPSASIEIERDDNIFIEESNSESTTLYLLSAGLNTSTVLSRQSEFEVNASIENGDYNGRNDENFTDISVEASYLFEPSVKFNSFVTLALTDTHEQNYLESLSTRQELDTYKLKELSGGFEYGLKKIGHPVVEASIRTRSRRHEQNFENKSRDELILEAAVKFPISPNMIPRVEASLKQFEYRTAIERDNREAQIRIGTDWQITAISTLKGRIGYQTKNFKRDSFDDDRTFTWKISYEWEPEDDTILTLTTSQEFSEADDSNAIDASHDNRKVTTLSWEQPWTRIFDTELVIGKVLVDSISTSNTDTDKRNFVTLSGNYLFSNIITLKAGIGKSSYDLETSGIDTDSNTLSISLEIAL